jgi:hypothetical protein
MLKAGYRAIKQVRRSLPVVTGSTCCTTAHGGGDIGSIDFLDRMYAHGAKRYFDAIGFHVYAGGTIGTVGPDIRRTMEGMRAVRNANGDRRPFWITETGFSSHGRSPWSSAVFSPRSQALSEAIAYRTLASMRDVRAIYFYILRDRPLVPGAPATGLEPSMGFFRANFRPKPAVRSLLGALGRLARPAAARNQSTLLISRTPSGSVPNGDSTGAVISNDKRYARAIAFESDASDLVTGDTNGVKDVFAVKRSGSIGNLGAPWSRGSTILISRTVSGAPADGPSSSPSIDGSFHTKPTCVGFLSAATNLVSGDTNGQVDAFVKKLSGGAPKRISLPGGHQSAQPTTAVAVAGNCKLIAFVTGGRLYVSNGSGRPRRVSAPGTAADPSFSTGLRNDLVFGARGGVYLAKDGTGRPELVGKGGRNPAYNDIKRRTVAYEKLVGGHWQIAYHDIGKGERIVSANHGRRGDGDSRNPVIGNSGYYVTFESDATNLATTAGGSARDHNGKPDIYLYTDNRKITLVESSVVKGEPAPGGGKSPGMSFYANYIVFDSPGSIRTGTGPRSIFMRYLGGL